MTEASSIASLSTKRSECTPSIRNFQSPSYQCQILRVPSSSNQEMVELSLLKLANMTCRTDDAQANQRDLCNDGSHIDILQVMKRYPNNLEIQQEAIGALANLAAHSAEAQSMIGTANGMEQILVSMKSHAYDCKIQDDGCCALWILVDQNHTNALRFMSGGGMKTVVEAMRQHQENDYLQHDACFLIENYCKLDPRFIRDICKAGGVSALAAVIENFKMDDETRIAACSALRRITTPATVQAP